MSENCSGQCSSCGENCSSRQAESLLATISSLALLALLYVAAYWWGRRSQRIEETELERYAG